MPHHRDHQLPHLPLVMFIHGLGGQLNQFEPLIDYFAHFATVLSIDLPGHGKSELSRDWAVYQPDFLVDLLHAAIKAAPDSNSRDLVLIGHSMGSVLAARLARKLGSRCVGLISICPPAKVDPALEKGKKWLGYLPKFVMDIFRSIDRVGGLHSKSVDRMVGPNASNEIRTKQLRWNLQVNTVGWMMMAYSFTPATAEEWTSIGCPLYLIGAENDKTTPADLHIGQIMDWMGDQSSKTTEEHFESLIISDAGHAVIIEKPEILCGKIGDFISHNVDEQLSLPWQLAFFAAQMDKWSLKNEAKWRRTRCVGDRVIGTPFRGMKTLRQDDQEHSPSIVEAKYLDIQHIIDISREHPPYEPLSFRRIEYHKFPTVSKIPPTVREVDGFIKLVDECLEKSPEGCVAVHCHYGFNRTGFFIVSYMIVRLGFGIKEAVKAFEESRRPGIKHPHFIDELYIRYS